MVSLFLMNLMLLFVIMLLWYCITIVRIVCLFVPRFVLFCLVARSLLIYVISWQVLHYIFSLKPQIKKLYWPVGLSLGGHARVPVVLVVGKQNAGEGGGKALPAFIIQAAISLHQPSHEEHSSSNLLLHGCTHTHPLTSSLINTANSKLHC